MKRIFSLVMVLAMLFSLTGCFNSNETTNSTYLYVLERLGLNISNCEVIEDVNTHDGCLGDGDRFIEINCSDDEEHILERIEEWNSLPLSENLELIMYGGLKDGVNYSYDLAENYSIPEIINGYYYFIDRYSEATDSFSDDELFDRYSFNFTLAMYDSDTKTLYYYEFDT